MMEPAFEIVVVVGSHGSLGVLKQIVSSLPEDFSAPVIVVRHMSQTVISVVPQIIQRHTSLRCSHAQHGERLRPGLHIAPPGRHLIVESDGTMILDEGPKVNYCRPAGDPLFRSAATVYGHGTLGVVLSGYLNDGMEGCRAIRAVGGVIVAQDPQTCIATSMPQSVIDAGAATFVLPPQAIGASLVSLVSIPGIRSLFGLQRDRAA